MPHFRPAVSAIRSAWKPRSSRAAFTTGRRCARGSKATCSKVALRSTARLWRCCWAMPFRSSGSTNGSARRCRMRRFGGRTHISLAPRSIRMWRWVWLRNPRSRARSARPVGASARTGPRLPAGRCGGVHALAAACGYAAIGAPIETMLEAYATTIVAAFASVAARAVPLGQRDVARARWALRPAIACFVTLAAAARAIDDLRASAVACEIDGLAHRRLPARLFAS